MEVNELTRLQKYLADAGVASRRKAEELITQGKVYVNGKKVTQLGTKVCPQNDVVTINGKVVRAENVKTIYIMLHKPEGVITSASDPHGRPVVTDFVKDVPARLFPVGRLDYDSSGLLLLTNDGNIAQKLTHPKYEIHKTYVAKLKNTPTKESLISFKNGLIIEDDGKKTAPAKIKIIKKAPANKGGCTVQITITEGRNRQVRKMCAAIGCPVLQLKRIGMGTLKLGGLDRGKYRHLAKDEVKNLLSGVNPTPPNSTSRKK